MSAPGFFDRLNYDVRTIIYSYMILPSVSNECVGFVLSCRDAMEETAPQAVRNLNQVLTNLDTYILYGEEIEIPTNYDLKKGYTQLNEIKLTVHPRTILPFSSDDLQGRLILLLGMWFRRITVFFGGQLLTFAGENNTREVRQRVEVVGHDILEMIQGLYQYDLSNPSECGGRTGIELEPCHTKDIELKWDARDPHPETCWLESDLMGLLMDYSVQEFKTLPKVNSTDYWSAWEVSGVHPTAFESEWPVMKMKWSSSPLVCQVGQMLLNLGQKWKHYYSLKCD